MRAIRLGMFADAACLSFLSALIYLTPLVTLGILCSPFASFTLLVACTACCGLAMLAHSLLLKRGTNRQRIAMHEAGHAVLGHYLGGAYRPIRAVIAETGGAVRIVGAELTFAELGIRGLQDYVVMTLGGIAVERHLGLLPSDANASDLTRAIGVTRELANHIGGWPNDHLEDGYQRARAMVAEHWDEIQRFAAELELRSVLNEDDIEAFFAKSHATSAQK